LQERPKICYKKQWYYLYRAVDFTGATTDFMLSATRDAQVAERFFRKALVPLMR
jgi:transposase-like protein